MEEQGLEHLLPASEFFIYAGRFMHVVRNIHETDGNGVQQIRAMLSELNNSSILRSQPIKVSSQKLLIDWSCGEADPNIAVEEIQGELIGTFIGYQVVPDENPYTGEVSPALAVAIATNVEDPDLDTVEVVALAAIPSASIELME